MTRRQWSEYAQAGATPSDDDARLAANVARLRSAHRMKQSELADAMCEQGRTSWRQTTVSRVENGQQRLTGADLVALQQILGAAVLDGTQVAWTMQAALPEVRNRAAVAALDDAEQALQHALSTVQRVRALYTDDDKENDRGDD